MRKLLLFLLLLTACQTNYEDYLISINDFAYQVPGVETYNTTTYEDGTVEYSYRFDDALMSISHHINIEHTEEDAHALYTNFVATTNEALQDRPRNFINYSYGDASTTSQLLDPDGDPFGMTFQAQRGRVVHQLFFTGDGVNAEVFAVFIEPILKRSESLK